MKVWIVKSTPHDLPLCSQECILAAFEYDPPASRHSISPALAHATLCYCCGLSIAEVNEAANAPTSPRGH
jgi:hypothetical protein